MRASVAACCASGSFPLTQGKQVSVTRHRHHRGLIPAHAGKTVTRLSLYTWTAAHPRSRGENVQPAGSARASRGSSPLTRGKHVDGVLRALSEGLIPAHAGKTCRCPGIRPSMWAHPRSRGENFCGCSAPDADWGSSPLTRGKLASASQSIGCSGLIPAHAAKTIARCWVLRYRGAHPRSRGENTSRWAPGCSPGGSSPLTRGKRARAALGPCLAGLIPAHAGKTECRAMSTSALWAHPHSRGENSRRPCNDIPDQGSSPLTRGKRSRAPRPRGGLGLIPAHAGKTLTPGNAAPRLRAHPRSRGENGVL